MFVLLVTVNSSNYRKVVIIIIFYLNLTPCFDTNYPEQTNNPYFQEKENEQDIRQSESSLCR